MELSGLGCRVQHATFLTRSTRARRVSGIPLLGDNTGGHHGAAWRFMLTVLGGLAKFERELIRARIGKGRDRANERGVHKGRPAKLTVHQEQDAAESLCVWHENAGRLGAVVQRQSKHDLAPFQPEL